jgi:hypothetical protein
LFNEALDLWRGEPFTTLDTPWANDLRTSLEAEQFSVLLDRNDAALADGSHAERSATWPRHCKRIPLMNAWPGS